jgi:alanyl aminopeptidase
VTRAASVAALLLAAACAGPRTGTAPPVTAAPSAALEPPDGNARLTRDAVPTHYTLRLDVDPTADRLFGGEIIDVDVAKPTRRIVLHGEKLTIREATVTTGTSTLSARVTFGPNGGMAVETDADVPAGRATLTFHYDAPISEVQEGAFRVTTGGAEYVFTQFESLYARRAFPCFDEPGFKTPWSITLTVPHGLVAASNEREVERTTVAGIDSIRFAETQPLPTYLVAWCVGPFDVVGPIATGAPGGAGSGGLNVPIRILAPRGQARLASWAAERAPKALAALERWTGEPYPFGKLDLVAIPGFDWGGMENAGLITFGANLLLLDPATASPSDRSAALTTISHEMAHMWFGDLVTMGWWDDVWLNEAFATLMESRIADAVEPDLRCGVQALMGVGDTMRLDAKTDTRAIRQPIQDGGDVFNAFDDITYGKGCRVLAMIEAWMGPENFQRAMRKYLAAHSYGTATTEDLYAALGSVTDEPVGDVLRGFVDRPGTPMLDIGPSSVKLDAAVVLAARQSRWQPIGGRAPQPESPWKVPAAFRDPYTTRCVIAGPEFMLLGRFRWILPDAGATGYYVWKLPEKEIRALALGHLVELTPDSDLTPAESIAFVRNLSLLVESGDVSVKDYIDGLEAFARYQDPLVLTSVVNAMTRVSQIAVDESVAPKYAAWVRARLESHVRRVGFAPRADEPPDVRMFRESMMRTLLFVGRDETLRAAAQATALRFLADPSSMPTDQAEGALIGAARTGDAALRDRYVAALAKAQDDATRHLIERGLAAFGDATFVAKSLDLVLDGTLPPSDLWRLTSSSDDDPAIRRACWAWITKHYTELRKLQGEEQSASIPSFASSFRTLADRDAVAAFFASIPSPPEGTERNLAVALETIEQNARLHDALAPGVAAYLAGR